MNIPDELSDLSDDSTHRLVTDTEKNTWDNKADISDIPDVSSFITKDANNLTYYELKTNTGSLIDLEINQSTYVVTLKLKNSDGTVISTDAIDLPLETVVVGGSYDSQTKEVVLTLDNGNEVRFSVADLVSGLQSEITSSNKLESDLVDDSNSGNKFVTTSEKQAWNNKLDSSALNNYVQITDYPTATSAGVVKINSDYGTAKTSVGALISATKTYQQYLDATTSNMFISKGTLENVITGKGLIDNTYYSDATTTTSGLMSSSDKTKLDGIDTGAEVNVQADWDEDDADNDAYIQNKPYLSKYYIGTCSTKNSTKAKVVVCSDFVLETGATIGVIFTNAQTYNGAPSLNVNGTGAIDVQYKQGTAGIRYMWNAGDLIDFTYNGTNWVCHGRGLATTSYYGVTKLSESLVSTSASLASTPSAINKAMLNIISGTPIYSSSATYAVGDMVRYTDNVWKCTTAIDTAESWNANHWEVVDTLQTQIDNKQDTLVSGTNIKTINNQSIVGSGNIEIQGGGGGTSDYSALTNKPSINNVTLSGDKSLSDLGVQPAGNYLTSETDPVFSASASAGITSTDITNWNNKGTGTITGITMNGSSKGTSGVVDLGTVITSHQDISGKQNINDNTLETVNKTIPSAINEVNDIAKGANQALSYASYSAMVTAFNSLDDDEYNVGQNVYIITTEVPDLWVSSVESTSSTYTYVDDATIISALETNGYIQVGYYKLSMLETQKVDLTNYVTNTDYASDSTGGVIKTSSNVYGTGVSSGSLIASVKSYDDYPSASNNMFISKGTLENAITGKGLGTYSKPSGGIPKSDLTSTVQTSLGKADTSVQKDGGSAVQTIALSSGTGTTALGVKSRASSSYVSFTNSSNWLGSIGVTSDKKPTFYNGSSYMLAYTSDIPTALSSLSDDSTHRLVTDTEKSTWNGKQAELVSGTNIKTINNTSILGSGNISLPQVTDSYSASTTDSYSCNYVNNNFQGSYNLITDGSAVKTGRQVDGKDEWVKRFSFTTSGNNTYTKSLGFVLNDVIITKLEGTEISNTGNWWNANIGDTQSSGNYAQNVRLMHDNSTIVLTSNANFRTTYIDVYYIYRS